MIKIQQMSPLRVLAVGVTIEMVKYKNILHTVSHAAKTVLQMGLEPMTLGLLDPRSNQLSYKSSLMKAKKSRIGIKI